MWAVVKKGSNGMGIHSHPEISDRAWSPGLNSIDAKKNLRKLERARYDAAITVTHQQHSNTVEFVIKQAALLTRDACYMSPSLLNADNWMNKPEIHQRRLVATNLVRQQLSENN